MEETLDSTYRYLVTELGKGRIQYAAVLYDQYVIDAGEIAIEHAKSNITRGIIDKAEEKGLLGIECNEDPVRQSKTYSADVVIIPTSVIAPIMDRLYTQIKQAEGEKQA